MGRQEIKRQQFYEKNILLFDSVHLYSCSVHVMHKTMPVQVLSR